MDLQKFGTNKQKFWFFSSDFGKYLNLLCLFPARLVGKCKRADLNWYRMDGNVCLSILASFPPFKVHSWEGYLNWYWMDGAFVSGRWGGKATQRISHNDLGKESHKGSQGHTEDRTKGNTRDHRYLTKEPLKGFQGRTKMIWEKDLNGPGRKIPPRVTDNEISNLPHQKSFSALSKKSGVKIWRKIPPHSQKSGFVTIFLKWKVESLNSCNNAGKCHMKQIASLRIAINILPYFDQPNKIRNIM